MSSTDNVIVDSGTQAGSHVPVSVFTSIASVYYLYRTHKSLQSPQRYPLNPSKE